MSSNSKRDVLSTENHTLNPTHTHSDANSIIRRQLARNKIPTASGSTDIHLNPAVCLLLGDFHWSQVAPSAPGGSPTLPGCVLKRALKQSRNSRRVIVLFFLPYPKRLPGTFFQSWGSKAREAMTCQPRPSTGRIKEFMEYWAAGAAPPSRQTQIRVHGHHKWSRGLAARKESFSDAKFITVKIDVLGRSGQTTALVKCKTLIYNTPSITRGGRVSKYSLI